MAGLDGQITITMDEETKQVLTRFADSVEKLAQATQPKASTPATAPAPAKSEPAPAKKSPGRPKKEVAPAPEPEDKEEESDDASETEDENEEFSMTDDEAPEAETETAVKITPTQILKAFKDYATSKGREPALAILKKYKVTSTKDIPAAKYPEVMKLLGK